MKRNRRHLPFIMMSVSQVLLGIIMLNLPRQESMVSPLWRLMGVTLVVGSCVPLFYLFTTCYHQHIRLFAIIASIVMMIVGLICAIAQAVQDLDTPFSNPIFVILFVVGYELFFLFNLRQNKQVEEGGN